MCSEVQQVSGRGGTHNLDGKAVFECDILVIGAGAAGLAAAAAVHDEGRRVIVIEKEDHVGGTTFGSGGCMWIPNNLFMQELGIEDSTEQAECYINTVEKATRPALAEDTARQALRNRWLKAFLMQGPEMMRYFRDQGFRWMPLPSKIPDYHPHVEGAVEHGRTLDPEVFDAATLEDWLKYLPAQSKMPVIPRFQDLFISTRHTSSTSHTTESAASIQCMGRPTSMGQSLIAQLLNIWGFSQNQVMRNTYLRIVPAEVAGAKMVNMADWSLAARGDVGVALQVGERLGADSAQLGQVWGIPTRIDFAEGRMMEGKVTEAMFAISKPFSFVVDGHGRRFFSESQPYGPAVRAMYERAKENSKATVFWLIFDSMYMQEYPPRGLENSCSIDVAVNLGSLFRSDTIDDLAKQILEPDHHLQSTVVEWNEMCENGHDKYFHRGEDRYQQFTGDPDVTPNPCMGTVKESPFYAMKIFPGDAGTRGGLLTDEFARVLGKSGIAIPGLYAGGNASVALLESQGAGTTLAPAMTEGFIAVSNMLSVANGAEAR
ncbi:3-ketosteroid 1-dehydrogenase helE [Fusarium oxysporum f. sp. rapae]|uniref:3-ketosteroid 1-dehydrogenase helE n=1 Tax=Fusarium oxysporum f. sp. rapae TaxID=485398 RepID=A0A8J5U3W8_FUSOX|nr:3-ketosteroid 1-dehydrogenase helE [Fusarium oxysporum f. sp. rapae]